MSWSARTESRGSLNFGLIFECDLHLSSPILAASSAKPIKMLVYFV
jgi:hypothetical protein